MVGEDEHAFRPSLAGYTLSYLRFVWTLAETITVATYALWAFEMQPARDDRTGARAVVDCAVRAGSAALGLAWLLLLGMWNG